MRNRDLAVQAIEEFERRFEEYPECLRPRLREWLQSPHGFTRDREKVIHFCGFPPALDRFLGVSPETLREMAVAAVTLFCYYSLKDTIFDGEGRDREAEITATFLHDDYRRIFEKYLTTEHGFWKYYRDHQIQWAGSVFWERQTHHGSLHPFEREDFQLLARKAAPFKTCYVACFMLGNREEDIPQIERMVDHYFAMIQLGDDLEDLRIDLSAHNYTYLIYRICEVLNLSSTDDLTPQLAARALLGHGLLDDYLDLAERFGRQALEILDRMGCEDLNDYVGYSLDLLGRRRDAGRFLRGFLSRS